MLLTLILSVHFLADFYFQPNSWAVKKYSSEKYLWYHTAVHFFMVEGCVVLFAFSLEAIKAGVCIALAHLVIDILKICAWNRCNHSALLDLAIFCIDQILHIISICVVLCLFQLPAHFDGNLEIMCIQYQSEKITNYLLLGVLLFNPASIFIKKLTAYISSGDGSENANIPPAGSLIGKIERLIIVILVVCNEIGAIGFVLAAKSFARYKQFEEQNFTEKFLVGTLASTAIAMILAVLLIR